MGQRMDQVSDYNNNAMLLLTVASAQCSFVAEDEEFSKTLQRKETEMKILHGQAPFNVSVTTA